MAVNKKNKNFYKLNPFKFIKTIEVKQTKNIIDTIEMALININTEYVLINPITSISKCKKLSRPFIEFGSKMIPKENWSSISFMHDGTPVFHSKSDKNSKDVLSYPFTGRILAKTKDILIALKEINEFEKNDLLTLAKILYLKNKIKLKFDDWLDIGHIATYPQTRISSISSRFFNSLIYNKKET